MVRLFLIDRVVDMKIIVISRAEIFPSNKKFFSKPAELSMRRHWLGGVISSSGISILNSSVGHLTKN